MDSLELNAEMDGWGWMICQACECAWQTCQDGETDCPECGSYNIENLSDV